MGEEIYQELFNHMQEEHGLTLFTSELQMIVELCKPVIKKQKDDEPYFGWCEVEGCENEGANGGGCWREAGYWTVCSKHSQEYRKGKSQPKMKQLAIDREKTRDKKTGVVAS